MDNKLMERIMLADMNAGRSNDFTTGRFFCLENENRNREDVAYLCSRIGRNFAEVWAGIEFQQAVNACIRNGGI